MCPRVYLILARDTRQQPGETRDPLTRTSQTAKKAITKGASTLQVPQRNWWSGLVEQLKSPDVDDKTGGFIASNEADRLCHPIQLNVGKRQRKAAPLRNLRFLNRNFCQPLPHHNREFEGLAIAMGENWMTKIAAEKIENKFSKMLYEEAISRI